MSTTAGRLSPRDGLRVASIGLRARRKRARRSRRLDQQRHLVARAELTNEKRNQFAECFARVPDTDRVEDEMIARDPERSAQCDLFVRRGRVPRMPPDVRHDMHRLAAGATREQLAIARAGHEQLVRQREQLRPVIGQRVGFPRRIADVLLAALRNAWPVLGHRVHDHGVVGDRAAKSLRQRGQIGERRIASCGVRQWQRRHALVGPPDPVDRAA